MSEYIADAEDFEGLDLDSYDVAKVRIVADETLAVHRDTAEFGDGQTIFVPQASATGPGPVQVLPRRPSRYRAIINAGGIGGSGAVAGNGAFAAAGAGSAVLPAGYAMTGFIITSGQVAAAASGVVTVTGLAGGTQSYEYVFPNAGNSPDNLIVNFPAPIPAANAGAVPTVTMPAVVGGAAGNIVIFGQSQAATGIAGSVLLASRIDFLQVPNPVRGYTLSLTAQQLEIKNQEPWYAIGIGGSANLSVLDEGWL